jgi:hypothetical protein
MVELNTLGAKAAGIEAAVRKVLSPAHVCCEKVFLNNASSFYHPKNAQLCATILAFDAFTRPRLASRRAN